MQEKRALFKTTDFFMLRSPLFSISEDYKNLSKHEVIPILKKYAENPYVREAIAVSSPTLYSSLDKLNGDPTTKKTRNTISGLLKFLLRMTTRATPFGLFSGVTIGKFDESTQANLPQIAQNIKRTRPDMEWLLGIVFEAEKAYPIIKDLKVVANPSTYITGERIHLSYHSHCGQLKKHIEKKENISINYSTVVQEILNFTNTPSLFVDISNFLQKKYPEANSGQINSILLNLVKEEFLLSELRPPLVESAPLKYIINVLDKSAAASPLSEQLKDIQLCIEHYDSLPIGSGISEFFKVSKKMKSLNDVNTPLQVDLKLNMESPMTLNHSIREEVVSAAEWLWRMSKNDIGIDQLKEYHMNFLEKYGTNREVPLLDLLSEEKGLGSPYKFERTENPTSSQTSTHSMLIEKYMECLGENKIEIELHEKDKEALFDTKTTEIFAPNSGELYTEIISSSSVDIDKGDFLVSIGNNITSQELGQTFGRFYDMFEEKEINDLLKEKQSVDERFVDSSVVYVEATYIPEYGRSSNVALTITNKKHQFILSGYQNDSSFSIEASDIVVGATLKRLYLKSKKLNKRLVFTANNMLNYQNAPSIFRFLREVSLEDTKLIQPFNWGDLDQLSFLPRVKCGRVILSPAIWRLNTKHSTLGQESLTKEGWNESFKTWKEKSNVPRYVHLTFGDNRLLLDLNNPIHLAEVRSELKKKGRVQLRELASNYLDNNWIESDRGIHCAEVVIPFKKENHVAPKPKVHLHSHIPVSSNCIEKDPGSEWLSFNIYAPLYKITDVISKEITNFVNDLQQCNLIESWFYIRYHDPDPHIRLRFKGEPSILTSKVLPLFQKWFQSEKQNGKVTSYIINRYEREIERYGGLSLINDIERYFEKDSYVSAAVLYLDKLNKFSFNLETICAVNIVYFLNIYGWSFEKQLDWISIVTEKYSYIEDFRPHRKALIEITDPKNDWVTLKKSNSTLYSILEKRNKEIRMISQMINRENITNTEEKIVGSLIHMHCNRLLGPNRELENKSMAFVRHILESQAFWRLKGGLSDAHSQST